MTCTVADFAVHSASGDVQSIAGPMAKLCKQSMYMRQQRSFLQNLRRSPDMQALPVQVAVGNGKQREDGRGSKNASRGSTPATDAATTSGGEEAEDRWDSECIECGQEGDPLLCCEVRHQSLFGISCPGISHDSSCGGLSCSLTPIAMCQMSRPYHPPISLCTDLMARRAAL